MLLLIGVALTQTRAASRGFATATGANGGTLLRLPVREDASFFDDNFCCHNKLNTGQAQLLQIGCAEVSRRVNGVRRVASRRFGFGSPTDRASTGSRHRQQAA